MCRVCEVEKSLVSYNVRKGKRESGNKHRTECKECQKSYEASIKERRRKRYLDNKDEVLRKCKEYRQEHREEISARRAEQRRLFARKVHDYYGGSCFICGVRDDFPEVYDCHHVDPGNKEKGICTMYGSPWERVVTELEKCIYLCANCHRKLHNNRFDKQIETGELLLTPGRRG